MEKIKKIEVKCIGLDENGEGIVEIDKKKQSVFGLLPSEKAIISINSSTNYTKIKLVKVLKASSLRQSVTCGIYGRCGGCRLLHIKYKEQLEYKRQYVSSCFKNDKIPFKFKSIYGAKRIEGYRNKMQVAYRSVDGKVVCGFYEEGTHKIIPLENCLVQTSNQMQVVTTIKQLLIKMRIAPYDEDRRTGYIRFVLLREGFKSKEMLVTIVTASDIFPGRNDFIKKLREHCPFITTIVQNINNRKTSIILGEQEKVLYGPGFIYDYLCDIRFKISSKSFFQINPEQTEVLYNLVMQMAAFKGNENIIDAYCGVGTIGIIMSKVVKSVIGVELNKQAIQNAITNSRDNEIKNINFINADATEFISKYKNEYGKIDALIMDPPRNGSTEKFLQTVLKLEPSKIVYVSCEASTLTRDLRTLIVKYDVQEVNLVDLFIGTSHIECVALLELKK